MKLANLLHHWPDNALERQPCTTHYIDFEFKGQAFAKHSMSAHFCLPHSLHVLTRNVTGGLHALYGAPGLMMVHLHS